MPPACSATRDRAELRERRDLPRYAIELGLDQIVVAGSTAIPTGTMTTRDPAGRLLVGIGGTPRRRADWLLEAALRWQDQAALRQSATGPGSPLRLSRCDGRQLAKELRRCRADGSLDPLRKLLMFGSAPPSAGPVRDRRRGKAAMRPEPTIILVNRIDQAAGRTDNQLVLCQLIDAVLQTPTLLAVTLPEHPACLPLHPSLESRLTGGLVLPLQQVDPPVGSFRPERPPTVRRIIASVARYYGIDPEDILGGSQRRCHVRPRGLAIHCIRLLTGKSTHAIGLACGGRDHTTVLHSLKVTNQLLLTDPGLAGDRVAILASLRPRSVDLSKRC